MINLIPLRSKYDGYCCTCDCEYYEGELIYYEPSTKNCFCNDCVKNNYDNESEINPQAAYQEFLKSKKWKEVRLRVFKRDNYTCQYCGSKENLEAHHISYNRLTRLDNIKTCCHICHDSLTWDHPYDSYNFIKQRREEMSRKSTMKQILRGK